MLRVFILCIAVTTALISASMSSAGNSVEKTNPKVVNETHKQPAWSPEETNANKAALREILAQSPISFSDIRHFGYAAIPILTELYAEAESNSQKAKIASVFWRLGWKSPAIEAALMDDLDSEDAGLKVQVQWGIAKSSSSDKVIKKLLYNLENDQSPFVRDKAACALASDFIHISATQRLMLLRGLVDGLDNDIHQVRASSIQALQIQTGQTKGFYANASAGQRAAAIKEWLDWLDEYQASL